MASDRAAHVAGLKDFQRRTVEYVFRRMHGDPDPARRFLVADEVGLGKTLVARGLIAMIVDHLKAKGAQRIDVVYICSNADIARQNVNRLNISGLSAFEQSTRLTLLPLSVRGLRDNALNFISFTPATTFDHGHRTGMKKERQLLYQMLHPRVDVSRKGLLRLLQGNAGSGWFKDAESPLSFDNGIADTFFQAVRAASDIDKELAELCAFLHDGRHVPRAEEKTRCLRLIGGLRRLLAKSCLDALEPDLVILDEFQRFKDLFDDPETNPVAELARELFCYPNPDLRVLLLSATPYKMFARDVEDEDHYTDFLQTMAFLLDDPIALARLEEDLGMFRRGLHAAGSEEDLEALTEVKVRVEQCLRQVMCRTERVGATVSLDAMVEEQRPTLPLAVGDLVDLRLVDAVGRSLGERDPLEYWNSSPYLLSFMKEYRLKQKLREKLDERGKHTQALVDILREYPQGVLHKARLADYEDVDPGNARLRLLLQEIVDSGLWRLLWLPPSLPYWRPEGVFEGVTRATKTLVFSGWNVVPDAIAAILSYSVERLMVRESRRKVGYENFPEIFRPRLHFGGDPSKSQLAFRNLAGHMTQTFLFPSTALASLVDPLDLACASGQGLTLSAARAGVEQKIRERLVPFLPQVEDGAEPDPDWYWRALIFLERAHAPATRDWCAEQWSMARTGQAPTSECVEEPAGFRRFAQSWLNTWDGHEVCSGRPPDDLCAVLADMALAGPAVCALRALRRAGSGLGLDDAALRNAAVFVAEGLRAQFNSPEAVALVGGARKGGYWRHVLDYCASGNLQAVLDEQVHVLRESLGLLDASGQRAVMGIAEELRAALSLRASTLRPDEISIGPRRAAIEQFSVRCHYALRFGDVREEDKTVARKGAVRTAFNSPFRPFVLASTSVGQEGLDFHVWCHSLVHWNLPANPVDLEQREGRVHRYKGLAVRKNVAAAFGLGAVATTWTTGEDPWCVLFERAHAARGDGHGDLVPYWIFEIEGGARVERRILAMPYSRDEGRYHRLQRSLALYRMVFGQPRQEDLLEYLCRQFGPEQAVRIANRWRIRLEPPEEE